MKYLLMFWIQLYWKLPNRFKNKCLHKESCSRYVYRNLKHGGIIAGYNAFNERLETCTPNYRIVDIDQSRILICANGEVLQNIQIAEWLTLKREDNS